MSRPEPLSSDPISSHEWSVARTLARAWCCGVAFAFVLGFPRALAQPPLIRELAQGSWIEALEPVLIPANAWEVGLGESSTLRCKLRMSEAKPYARVLPRGARLKVDGVRQAGFTARRQISLISYVQFNSKAIDDLCCSGAVRSDLSDLRRALGRRFALRQAAQESGSQPAEIPE